MTPEEFADHHGLSIDEAKLILASRARPKTPEGKGRLAKALEVLQQAQRKVGVQPVVEGYSDDLVRTFDQEAADNLDKFYANKAVGRITTDEGGLDE